MIPILYSATETSFTTNGLGRLPETLWCTVDEERNGAFEMSMELPVDAAHYSDISLGCLIMAKPSPTRSSEPFEVYSIEESMDGMTAVIRAQHVSYRLSHIPVEPFTAASATDALSGISTHSLETNPFSFYTDVTRAGTYTQTLPSSAKNRLLGESGSILQVYQGEYEWSKFNVRLLTSRGNNNGVTIRYGKNLTSFNQEKNIQNTITGIMPYWSKTDNDGNLTLVTLTEKILYASNAGSYPFHRTTVMDFSGKFQDAPTEAQLRTACQAYIDDNNIGTPSVSIDVSFAELSKTTEYASIANLERVELCDTVTVIFPKFGTTATAKVVHTSFDALNERYNTVTIGDAKTTLSDTIAGNEQGVINAVKESRDFMQAAIALATSVINGSVTGSSMQTLTDADGNPQGLIIMDTQDASTAVNCIRINANGIGFSTSGVDGPYTTAIYYDSDSGEWVINSQYLNVLNLNASNITSGSISADRISGGTITGVNINISNGSLSFDISTGETIIASLSAGFKTLTSSGEDNAIAFAYSPTDTRHKSLRISVSGISISDTDTGRIAIGPGGLSIYDANDLLALSVSKDGVVRYNNGSAIDGDKTVTAASGVTFARKHLRVFGKMAFFSGVFTSTSVIASGSKIATLSIAGQEVTDFTLSTSAGTTAQAVVNGSNFNANGALAANTNYFFNGTYYVG